MAQAICPVNGGNDTYSFVKNSSIQKARFIATKDVIKEALVQNLDIKTLLSGSTTFTIADLGCALGPTTLLAMETIVEMVENKYHSECPGSKKPIEFQVFFNDLSDNDFNTLFASLPDERKYFAAGVPGSFFTRLFPCSSIHIAYASSSLQWLSKLPEELQDKNSPAWNPGRIHYTGAPEAVVSAYVNQFEEDMEMFLNARSQEIVAGGMVVIIMPGVPDEVFTHEVGIALTFLGSILMDMVDEGLLKQDEVDSFNFPHAYPCVKGMKRLVEKNGYFEIVKMELRNSRPNPEAPIDIESAIMQLRAVTETSVAAHLGNDEIVDQLYKRAFQEKTRFSHMLYSSGIQFGALLFAILKRK